MIRFILIGNQIVEDHKQDFAFFDTVLDRFIIIANFYIFESKADFEESISVEIETTYGGSLERFPNIAESFNRMRRLIPDNIT